MLKKICMICFLFLAWIHICVNADIYYVGKEQDYRSITEAVETEKSIYIHAAEGTYALFHDNTFTGNRINDLYFKNCAGIEYDNNSFSLGQEENVVIVNAE